MMKNITLLAILTLSMISCEETMIMIPDFEPPVTDKTVLIEDLTGVQCPNCPKGSVAIKGILDAFGENVYAIGIHGTLQASPIPGESKYDFRNQFAIDLEEFHKPWFGKPTALFNRVKFDGEINVGVDNIDLWFGLVDQELQRAPEVTLLLNEDYDETNRQISVEATIIPLEDLDGEYRVSVFVTESEIEDAQENQSIVIEEYEHNHVLRSMMTQFDGDVLGDDLKEDEQFVRNFSYTIPEEFNADHIEVVVSIHRNEGEDGRVLQTKGFKLKK